MVVDRKVGKEVGSICSSSLIEIKTEKAFTRRTQLTDIGMIKNSERDSSLMVIDSSKRQVADSSN